jgi:hypothetical protein
MRFILYPQNFVNQNVICPFIQIDKSNYIEHLSIVKECITLFNSELEWDGMYNLTDAIKRFEDGYVNFVLIENNVIYGYVWFIQNTTNVLLLNLFMRNNNIHKKYKGREFISNVIYTNYNECNIYNHVDEWNIKSINLFKSLGFIEYKD